MEDLLKRFEVAKTNLTEQWVDNGIEPPTDKEVWGQMRAVACSNMDDAFADDMQGYILIYQKRIEKIDKILAKL
jgi:hypothetical protein